MSVAVGDIAEQIRGVSYAKSDASFEPNTGLLPILRANNITDEGLRFSDLVYVPVARISPKQVLKRGDVVVAASSGSLDVVGKAADLRQDFKGAFGAFCKVLRPDERAVDPAYFSHFFRTPEYRRTISALAAGANINNLKNEHLDQLEIPLPPLNEQRRIAAILDKADALRRKRKRAIELLDSLTQSTFFELFGRTSDEVSRWGGPIPLSELAEIGSGITKGRKLNGQTTRQVRYLAVANVQDRRLDLANIKTIDATENEITRYRLRKDDLLLTEGGDPDKLGRGTLWAGEIGEAIHQNHIFRVRLSSDAILPLFLNWLVGSPYGKGYFLSVAKQTTGIASINKTQLSAFPTVVPPIDLQHRFVRLARRAFGEAERLSSSLAQSEALFSSLQHRAFSGQL